MKVPLASLALAAATLFWHVSATAQGYPVKPVRIVVPFPPGGGVDVLARAVGVELARRWKQPVIIDNKGGAGSMIGADLVAKAPADGYTLLATINQTMVTTRYLYKATPYNADKDFEPIMMMARSDQLIVASASLPANSLKEVVALARREPHKLSYGSYGRGSQPHLLFELLNKRESIDLLHVPYSGIAPMLTALASGEISLGAATIGVAGPLIAAGKIKAISLAGKERLAQLPNVTTTAQEGFPYAEATIWTALFAPAGTPRAVIEKLRVDTAAALKEPEFIAKHIVPNGLTVVASDGAYLRGTIRDEVQRSGEMIKAAGVTAE